LFVCPTRTYTCTEDALEKNQYQKGNHMWNKGNYTLYYIIIATEMEPSIPLTSYLIIYFINNIA